MVKMLILILLVAAVDGTTTQPTTRHLQPARLDEIEPPGRLGFGLYQITTDDLDGDVEAKCVAWIYGPGQKLLAKLHRGDALPQPFQNWRFVGLSRPQEAGTHRSGILITNVVTRETTVLEIAKKIPPPPSTRPVNVH